MYAFIHSESIFAYKKNLHINFMVLIYFAIICFGQIKHLRKCLANELTKVIKDRSESINANEIEVICNGTSLGIEHSLDFIQKTVWKSEELMLITYRRMDPYDI